MIAIEMRSVLEPPWTQFEPLRIGGQQDHRYPPELFVTIASEEAPLLRIDLIRSYGQCHAFHEVCYWNGYVAVGWGESVYLVDVSTRNVIVIELQSYFGQLYPLEACLLIATAECIFCVSPDGRSLWKSDVLGIDGVVIHDFESGVARGSGEWDPPGGWTPFRIHLDSGKLVD